MTSVRDIYQVPLSEEAKKTISISHFVKYQFNCKTLWADKCLCRFPTVSGDSVGSHLLQLTHRCQHPKIFQDIAEL